MSDMVIRDPDDMRKFSKEIGEYCQNMKRACGNLTNSIASAQPFMKDTVSLKALRKLAELISDILKGLPEAEAAAEMLDKAAKPLDQAKTLM